MNSLLNDDVVKIFLLSITTLLIQSLSVVLAFHLSKSFVKLEMDKSKRGANVLDVGIVFIFGIAISFIVPVLGTVAMNSVVGYFHENSEYLYDSYMRLLIIFSIILMVSYTVFAERFKFIHISVEEANSIDRKFFRLTILSLVITAFSYSFVNAFYDTEYRVYFEYGSMFLIIAYCFIELSLSHKHISDLLSIKKPKTKCISARLVTLINSKLSYVILFSVLYVIGANHEGLDKATAFENINDIYMLLLSILVFQGIVSFILNQFISYTYSLDDGNRSKRLLESRSKNIIYICDFMILSVYFIVICYGMQLSGIDIHKHVSNSGIIVVIFGVFITIMMGRIFDEFRDTILEKAQEGDQEHYTKLKTFAPTLSLVVYFVLVMTSLLIILANLGINITPILASFSIFSVAFALAAQDIVKSFIYGLILLMEKNLYIGDFVTINGHTGTIEKLSVRVLHLRATDGCLHVIPYSSVGDIINYSKDYSRHTDYLRLVSYDDLEKAKHILVETVNEMRLEPQYSGKILGNVTIHGVQPFDFTGVKVSWEVITCPGMPHIKHEIYARLFEKFREHNIKLPPVVSSISIEDEDVS